VMLTTVMGRDAAREMMVDADKAAVDVLDLSSLRKAQRVWDGVPIRKRLDVLRRARFAMSQMARAFSEAIPWELTRTPADTRVAEGLPLLAACRFLECNAEKILRARHLGRRGLPVWLAGLDSEVRRVPHGVVLVLGPSNYPLFLPGVQALQAIAAGNAVVWKPGKGGVAVAMLFAEALYSAGLPRELLMVTEDSVEAGERALRSSVDKVVFTGSAENARTVLRECSARLIPCVVEASGCDAVIVLPSADTGRVVKALAFGMRLNGSATCMAPRRVLLVNASEDRKRSLVGGLVAAFGEVASTRVADDTRLILYEFLHEAKLQGAAVVGAVDIEQRPILVTEARPEMRLARSDIFAPVLSMIDIGSEMELLAAQEICPFGLTASVFGEEREARRVAEMLHVGTVLINDVIVGTADPRVPFGGRRESGFGVTRGREGLLEMTAAKVVSVQRNKSLRTYEATGKVHAELFDGIIHAMYSQEPGQRWSGVRQAIRSARRLGPK
jgi:acyl-CoA reductase-like NAD-dependent aldehyde dehydrogenase